MWNRNPKPPLTHGATDDCGDACVDRLPRGGGCYQRLDRPGALLLRLGLRPEPLLLLVMGELPGVEGALSANVRETPPPGSLV